MASFKFFEYKHPPMPPSISARSALSAENLALVEAVSRLGSMAAAARELGMVPSALTYRIRQIEDALDVLLFDRSARRAAITPAGAELLRAGEFLLNEFDAVAQRVKRVATGWEPQLTIAADALISRATLFELCEWKPCRAPWRRCRTAWPTWPWAWPPTRWARACRPRRWARRISCTPWRPTTPWLD